MASSSHSSRPAPGLSLAGPGLGTLAAVAGIFHRCKPRTGGGARGAGCRMQAVSGLTHSLLAVAEGYCFRLLSGSSPSGNGRRWYPLLQLRLVAALELPAHGRRGPRRIGPILDNGVFARSRDKECPLSHVRGPVTPDRIALPADDFEVGHFQRAW